MPRKVVYVWFGESWCVTIKNNKTLLIYSVILMPSLLLPATLDSNCKFSSFPWLCTSWNDIFYYIHTEKYSPKSYVVNFLTQISSSQSEERTMVFTREKNDSNQKHRGVWVSRQTSRLLLQLAAPLRTHSTRKVLLKEFFSLKKWKIFRKWSGIVSFVSLSIKKAVESRRNNSGKGKTEREVSFCCAFCRSYFAFHLSLSLYWNRPFYLNSLIFNCALRTNS